jgi:hypothetical protein
MDFAIRFPVQGRIHLESRFLFAEPGERNCRQLVERVFQAPELSGKTPSARIEAIVCAGKKSCMSAL